MKDKDEFLAEVCDRLEQAQQHYKVMYDWRHRLVEFIPGMAEVPAPAGGISSSGGQRKAGAVLWPVSGDGAHR
jgi:hypothetical protein